MPVILANGTRIDTGPDWCRTTLPCGAVVDARPNDDSARMAVELGFGDGSDAVAAMTQQHDALHSHLCGWLGLQYSYSLMVAAGAMPDCPAAWHEEEAVLALQRLLNAVPDHSATAGK